MSFSITALSITKLRIITQNQDAQHDSILYGVCAVLTMYGTVLTKTAQHNDVQHNDTLYKELSITSLSMTIIDNQHNYTQKNYTMFTIMTLRLMCL